MKTRSLFLSVVVAVFVTHNSIAQYPVPYEESGRTEHGLLRVLRDEGRFSELNAELFSKILTVRSRADLSAGDLLKITEIVANFYEDGQQDGLAVAGVATLRIMWRLVADDGVSQQYEAGVAIAAKDLAFLASRLDALDVLQAFWVNFWRVIPPDKYEDGDDYRVGASESLSESRTLQTGDSDWFVYYPEAPGLYRIETKRVERSQGTGGVDTIVNVFVGRHVVTDDDDGFGLYSQALVCAEGVDPIYIEVVSEAGSSKPKIGYYRLEIERGDSVACSGEDDDPDDPSNSTSHHVREAIEGSLYLNDDIDWFRLRGLSRGRTYEAILSGSSLSIRGRLKAGDGEGIQLRPNVRIRFVLRSRDQVLLQIEGGEVATYKVTIVEDRPYEL